MKRSIIFSVLITCVALISGCSSSRYTDMGIHCYEGKNYTRALDLFQKAIDNGENSPELYYYKGMTNINQSRNVEGCEDLFRAKELGYRFQKEDLFFLGCQ